MNKSIKQNLNQVGHDLIEKYKETLKNPEAFAGLFVLPVKNDLNCSVLIGLKIIGYLEKCNPNPPQKLISLCKDLNVVYQEGRYECCAVIIRSILDHIPPIFGCGNIEEVFSNVDGRNTPKAALKILHQVFKNVADDRLHNQASKIELEKVYKSTIDNQIQNLLIVFEAVARKLGEEDLRDKKLSKTNKLKRTKTQLQCFEDYVERGKWYQQNVDDKSIWICEEDNLYQIHEQDRLEDFSEPWTRVYPDKMGSWAYYVDLVYNGNLIKRIRFVCCDGGRVCVVVPKTDLAACEAELFESKEDSRKFYWVKNSLEYKLMNLIVRFYSYCYVLPEDVARRSKIEIR